VDVAVGHLAVGQGVDTTVEGAFAAAGLAAVGTGVALGGAADDADLRQDHGLCSLDTEVYGGATIFSKVSTRMAE
jgi:hypothetical protein